VTLRHGTLHGVVAGLGAAANLTHEFSPPGGENPQVNGSFGLDFPDGEENLA
jgi:hypothetical protein